MATFKTTAAYISGGICGHMWMPEALAGKPYQANLRGPFGTMDRFTEPASFRDMLGSVLMREGGDFQDAKFTADTVIRIERTSQISIGRYTVHVKELPIVKLAADLVDPDAYTGDFLGDD